MPFPQLPSAEGIASTIKGVVYTGMVLILLGIGYTVYVESTREPNFQAVEVSKHHLRIYVVGKEGRPPEPSLTLSKEQAKLILLHLEDLESFAK